MFQIIMRRHNQAQRPWNRTSHPHHRTHSNWGLTTDTDLEYLRQLYNKSNEDILTEFSQKNTDFLRLIQNYQNGEKIYFLIGILSKIVSSPFNVHKGTILRKICNGGFFKEIFSFIMLLPSQNESEKKSNKTLWSNINTFWMNLIVFCSSLFDVIPTSAVDIVTKLVSTAQLTICNLEHGSIKIADEVKKELTVLNEKLQKYVTEIEEKRRNPALLTPPNDFRQISIYPTSEEILQLTETFLRKNKISGSYADVNEYLDIQFRLLREDYVKPLREGINDYIMQQSGAAPKKRILSVKVYKSVSLLEVVYVNGEIGRKIQINIRSKFDKGYNSKHLMYGGLVCFTKDHFKTIIFGRIICIDERLLKQNQIIVHLDANSEETCKENYVMVVCGIYFEPYYVVLKALQQFEIERFPLKEFIVDMNRTINCPEYLLKLQKKFPSQVSLKLNPLQYKAFEMALSKELVIIQGPPGTGKTHLGLKIVKTILEYGCTDPPDELIEISESFKFGPILVLCYTNHALDQFLVGISKFTDNIVRIGGQSKCEDMKKYNLKEVNKYYRNGVLEKMKEDLINTVLEIKEFNHLFDVINHCQGVIDFDYFRIIDPNFENSWFFNKNPEQIARWLCGGINRRNYIEEHELKVDYLQEVIFTISDF